MCFDFFWKQKRSQNLFFGVDVLQRKNDVLTKTKIQKREQKLYSTAKIIDHGTMTIYFCLG
jgi:hypothetical protein